MVKLRSAPSSACAGAAARARRTAAPRADVSRYERMAQVSIVTYRRVAKIRHDDAMRFMCVGDSMTIGRAGDFTWRYRMWQHLEAAPDGPHELVGPRTALYDAATGTASSSAYAADDFPRPPAATSRAGARVGSTWPLIADAVTAHRPDVLLVSLGLIDLGFYTDSAQTAENAAAFLTAAREANPRIRVVLLPVIPNIRAETDAPFAAECAHFNTLLAKTAANLSTPPSPSSWPPTPGVRHPHLHVRRHPPEPHRRTPPGSGLRGRAPRGVGSGRAVRGGGRLRHLLRSSTVPFGQRGCGRGDRRRWATNAGGILGRGRSGGLRWRRSQTSRRRDATLSAKADEVTRSAPSRRHASPPATVTSAPASCPTSPTRPPG